MGKSSSETAEPASPLSPYHRFEDQHDNNGRMGHALSPTTPGQLADIEDFASPIAGGGGTADDTNFHDSSSDDEEEGVFFFRSSDSGMGGASTDEIDVIGGNASDYVQHSHTSDYFPPSSRISLRNLFNLVAFGANLFIHYGIGVWGLNGILPTISEVTATHRTLITPVDWTHWLWAIIYTLEGIFVLAQLTPAYRSRPVVLQGAGYFFVYSCLAQIAWTMFYSFCMFLVAFIAMATNLVALCFLIVSQFLARSRDEGRAEYALLRFPFSLHVGWVFVETAVNFSILSQHSGLSEGEQLCAVIVSLGMLLMVASLFLGARTAKGLVVPAVMIWAFVGIGIALKHPNETLRNEFDDVIIVGVRRAALSFSVIISLVLAPRLVLLIFEEYFTIRIQEL